MKSGTYMFSIILIMISIQHLAILLLKLSRAGPEICIDERPPGNYMKASSFLEEKDKY